MPIPIPTILIVEDDIIIAECIKGGLIKNGYNASVMSGISRETLKQIEMNKPDLVLMDINIKGMIDGIETATFLHKQLGIPIIFLTAYGDIKTINKAKIAEPSGYIIKPYNEEQLYLVIEKALQKTILRKK